MISSTLPRSTQPGLFAPRALPPTRGPLLPATEFKPGGALEYRSMNTGDVNRAGPLTDVARLYNLCNHGSALDRDSWLAIQLAFGLQVTAACSHGTALGFVAQMAASSIPGAKEGALCVAEVGVLPQLRGQHLGRGLMLEALAEARAQGYTSSYLHVSEANADAIHLYQSLGYKLERALPNFYGPDTTYGSRNAMLMRLDGLQDEPVAQRLDKMRRDLEALQPAERTSTSGLA